MATNTVQKKLAMTSYKTSMEGHPLGTFNLNHYLGDQGTLEKVAT